MRRSAPSKTWFQKIEKLHPYETLLYLGMLGSGIIFLFLALAFLSSGREYLQGLNEQMPLAFLVSTFLLVLSGYTSVKMRIHYQEENSAKLHRSLKATFVLGILFTVFQILGWMELTEKGINFTGVPSGSFLYVLSGIHVVHLLGAMSFAVILLLQLRKIEQDMVRKLVWMILFLLFVLSF